MNRPLKFYVYYPLGFAVATLWMLAAIPKSAHRAAMHAARIHKLVPPQEDDL